MVAPGLKGHPGAVGGTVRCPRRAVRDCSSQRSPSGFWCRTAPDCPGRQLCGTERRRRVQDAARLLKATHRPRIRPCQRRRVGLPDVTPPSTPTAGRCAPAYAHGTAAGTSTNEQCGAEKSAGRVEPPADASGKAPACRPGCRSKYRRTDGAGFIPVGLGAARFTVAARAHRGPPKWSG